MIKARNILLIGRTGSGKSTLANVLVGTDKFKESSDSVSETKDFKKGTFSWKGINYCVIDTVGIGDTKLTKRDILYKMAQGVVSLKEGINQVFFVLGGKFTSEEVEVFELLKGAIFESGIASYVTIVRTKFDNFEEEEECEKDRKKLAEESEGIKDLVNSCRAILHVNNPSIDVKKESKRKLHEEDRKNSREKLLNYLATSCQGNYKPLSWENIYSRMDNYIKNKLGWDASSNKELEIVLQEQVRNQEEVAEQMETFIQEEAPKFSETLPKKPWWKCSIL